MTETDFLNWLEGYRQAWEQGDSDGAAGLFSEDALYYETPFDSPLCGRGAIRNYWAEGARDGQTGIRFSSSMVGIIANTGWAHWKATFTRVPSGRLVTLEGILSARFGSSGLCVEFREWWHRVESPPQV